MNLIEEIHNSMLNGQRKQAVRQIKEYNSMYDIFSDYRLYLENLYDSEHVRFNYYSDLVESYHRINFN